MIKIKSIGVPTLGAHWSMGPSHMRQISKKDAGKLCGLYPLPAMGSEIVCAIEKNIWGGFDRLMIQNISGMYFIACSQKNIEYWPDTFGVKIEEVL